MIDCKKKIDEVLAESGHITSEDGKSLTVTCCYLLYIFNSASQSEKAQNVHSLVDTTDKVKNNLQFLSSFTPL